MPLADLVALPLRAAADLVRAAKPTRWIGSGPPAATLGKTGDTYVDRKNSRWYGAKLRTGKWPAPVPMTVVPDGPPTPTPTPPNTADDRPLGEKDGVTLATGKGAVLYGDLRPESTNRDTPGAG